MFLLENAGEAVTSTTVSAVADVFPKSGIENLAADASFGEKLAYALKYAAIGLMTVFMVLIIIMDLKSPVETYDVLLVEDILDSGATLHYLKQLLLQRNPKSIRIATLFDKPERRKADIRADYIGAVVPDEFIVGYGLDFAEDYRNLPYIGVLKPEAYKSI